MARILFSVFFLTLVSFISLGKPNVNRTDFAYVNLQDTLEEEIIDSTALAKINVLNSKTLTIDSIDVVPLKNNPYLTIGDVIKGQASGVYVQHPSAEPGTFQNILVRGLSGIQSTNRDINTNRAAVYVNGIPMSLENSFSYDIQLYDYNRIGPATDYSSSIDMASIESIEVIKDPIRLAELGPLATNGAIWITTFGGKSGDREISVNAYYGFNTKPSITPINAEYEDMFRQNFYSRYASEDDKLKYPGYLSDSTNLNYYGSSNWQDLYYTTASLYSVDLSLRGGTDRANFGFLGSHTKNAISSDDTNLKRYNALFNVNMLPFEWLTVSSFINARRIERNRNRNLRDRYAEMAYLPDLTTPLAPNKNAYSRYLDLYNSDAVDDNVTNHLQGNIRLSVDILPNLNVSSSFALDYNEGIRDLFYPSQLMETINYMSTYYGYTQRFVFSNKISYWKEFNENRLSISAGSDYSEDLFRYNFARAYDGPNDYIKLNVVEGDSQKDNYLEPKGGLRVLRYNNKEQFNLHSLFGKIGYSYKDLLELSALLRWDGSSTVQRDSRWLFTPAAGAKWNLDKQLGLENLFNVQVGFSRVGKPVYSSRYASGPQYASSLGWTQDPTVSSYYGYAGISRDYSHGWTGYNLKWAYSDKYELTFNNSFLKDRLSTSFSFYQRDDKDQIVLIPVPLEYGYVGQHKNGLAIRNRGIDATINGIILPVQENKVSWTSSLNVNINRNELTALPNGLTELQMDGRLLRVGESIDQFWLYQNEGIYNSTSEIPVNPSTGLVLSNNGVPFGVGDAKWKDQNGDFVINEDDKTLQGRFTPKYYGGFNNTFGYKGFDLTLSFTYALGLDAINQRASNRYDFVNTEDNNSIGAVREIFQWQQDLDITKYPIYNVWSGTNPYREDQDLLLEDASYLKLRSVSFGYNLSNFRAFQSIKTLRRAYVYLTANNLFTITKFSGIDPELVNFNGVYDGYGLPLTQTYTLGIKLDL